MDKDHGNGNSAAFTKIELKGNLTAVIRTGTEQLVKLHGNIDENDINLDIQNDTLLVVAGNFKVNVDNKLKTDLEHQRKGVIEISVQRIEKITAEVDVELILSIESDGKLVMEAKGRADVVGSVTAKQFEILAMRRADVSLEGSCEELLAMAGNNAILDLAEMSASKAEVVSTDFAEVSVKVIDKLVVTATNKSVVKYRKGTRDIETKIAPSATLTAID